MHSRGTDFESLGRKQNMWPYEQISREEFEKVKDKVEQFMLSFGAEKLDLDIPYNQTTTSYCGDNVIKSTIGRLVFKYMDNYFRVDEVRFAVKPFVVFEFGLTIGEC